MPLSPPACVCVCASAAVCASASTVSPPSSSAAKACSELISPASRASDVVGRAGVDRPA
ncbi:hypothetical protein DICSQDRAFT_147972 [Dichomitus squalens LYAD-421 SS1]|uniref:Uncharacterized protein n=1 Tax=Dichomitus squalens (strain LYAD-421) TaxID=732165 RepID=R7SVT6_DICSQ|nr:uncharacterized protein DICSQDRAFT_147972 [Dichomitus squalens LYAD-421 SS1]EJF60304.1 hypothetical protein DICSQDRAFT_147972 [Dichomitus squalens LYAD-421 SS1]